MMVVAIMIAGNRLGIRVIGLKIDHQHAQRHPDLDRGETNPGGVVHRLEHVFDEGLQFRIELGDGDRDLLEHRIGDFEDFANSHGKVT